MGVRGLTTYIAQYSDRYLEPYELHDCSLVVDGNSLASLLYNWHSKCASACAFGGDYDKYSNDVKKFFIELKKCGVAPVVLFDGGYETRKLRTVMKRLRVKISHAKHVTPTSKNKIFPLLMKEVFKDVLLNLSIPLAQCYYEADDEIAAIARRLGCPVLSYDSDFYVYNVLYIPFSTVNIRAHKKTDLANLSDQESEYCISCNIYNVENVLNHFGGLNKSLIPLMATLLGNDYINRSVFKKFFSSLKFDKKRSSRHTQKRIEALLNWLQGKTLETAVEKILSFLKKKHRPYVSKQIKLTVEGYTHSSSNILPFLGLSTTDDSSSSPARDESCNVHMLSTFEEETTGKESDDSQSEECDKATNSSSEDEEEEAEKEKSESEEENVSIDEYPAISTNLVIENLPDWLKDSLQCGNLPSYFIDMLTRQTYFCAPQVEDYSLPFSHLISLPIIGVIYGLLCNNVTDTPLTYYSRNVHIQPEMLRLNPVTGNSTFSTFPSLAALADLPTSSRESILMETLRLSCEDIEAINKFPEDWRLFISSILYWARYCCQPSISNCHIHAVLFSIIALKIVDTQIGHYRSKGAISKAVTNHMKKSVSKEPSEENSDAGTKQVDVELSLEDNLAAITKDDCMNLAEILLPFHQVDDRLKGYHKLYSVNTVHVFAQLQSILFHVVHLNALLNFPLPQFRAAHFYSGTLVYNAYSNFNKRVDVLSYVTLILSCGPSVCAAYKTLTHAVLEMLPNVNVLRRKGKRNKRSRFCEKVVINEEDTTGNETIHCSNEKFDEFHDVNNRFSALCLGSESN